MNWERVCCWESGEFDCAVGCATYENLISDWEAKVYDQELRMWVKRTYFRPCRLEGGYHLSSHSSQ